MSGATNVNEIVKLLDEICPEMKMTKADFTQPDPLRVQLLYNRLLVDATGMDQNFAINQGQRFSQRTEYPELYEQTRSVDILSVAVKWLLVKIGSVREDMYYS